MIARGALLQLNKPFMRSLPELLNKTRNHSYFGSFLKPEKYLQCARGIMCLFLLQINEQVTTPNDQIYIQRTICEADEVTTPQFLCRGRGVRLITRERCLECRVCHVLCVEPRQGGVIRLQSRRTSACYVTSSIEINCTTNYILITRK